MRTKIIYCLLLCTTLLWSCNTEPSQRGTNYYLDAENGNDTNDGLSEEKPWKTLANIQKIKLEAGDSLLFRRGTTFNGILEISGQGSPDSRIVIDAYGVGEKPCIAAPDSALYTVCIRNSDYVTLQNLEITNIGKQFMPKRTGVKVLCEEYGTSHGIHLNKLNIHNIKGSLVKKEGGGSGILIENKWKETVSVFDSLLIEDCIIRRCERNAMIWNGPWSRKNWHLSTNTIVRRNLIEEVPGDGIVPIGCDGALIEYNLMRNCPATLPDTEAAAGMWPWSCDNTVIQFNEASDHKAPWDAQGFDSDYNCTNTRIQYNYSHDNEGGFVLVCNAGKWETDPSDNIGNIDTRILYNISINDAIRSRKARGKIFSPTIHIGGPVKDTEIRNNILHVNVKPESHIDRSIITSDSWSGYADSTRVIGNIFYTPETSTFKLTESTNNLFDGNYYLGTFKDIPKDINAKKHSAMYQSLLQKDPKGFGALESLMKKIKIADGEAYITVIDKEAIEAFFDNLKD